MTTRCLTFCLVALLVSLQPWIARAVDPSDGVITIYPITAGVSHRPEKAIGQIVVLSPHTGPSVEAALAAAKDVFQRGGVTVIEAASSSRPREAQGPALRDRGKTDRASVAVGQRAGADHVVVVEVTDTLVLEQQGNRYLHDERVSVRGLSVPNGTVVLEGTARWSQPIERAGAHMRELTAYAIARAICEPERWVEAAPANHGRGRCRP
jgi:hypothetical protein